MSSKNSFHLLFLIDLSPFGRRLLVWIVSLRIVCGLLTPCNLKYKPQALHTISPRTFRRQMVVVVVPQLVQDMSLPFMLLLGVDACAPATPPAPFGEATLELELPPPFDSLPPPLRAFLPLRSTTADESVKFTQAGWVPVPLGGDTDERPPPLPPTTCIPGNTGTPER